MMKAFLLTAALAIFCFPALAQTAPTESKTEKEKLQKERDARVLEILDAAVSDAGALRLAGNRAVVYVIAGDLYWKSDEKRARDLFRRAEGEILAALAEDDKRREDSDDPYEAEFASFSTIRNELLPLIARRDAELALQMLVATRPAKIAAALARALQKTAKSSGGAFSFDPDRYRVQGEIALEQQFALYAAEQNVDKAIKLFKASLERGLSWNVLPALQKIGAKDEKKAAALADEVVRRIGETDFVRNRDDLNAVIQILQYAVDPPAAKNAREKQFRLSDAQTRAIADKIGATMLQPSQSIELMLSTGRALPLLEKAIPEKMPLIRQKQAEMLKTLPPELQQMQERSRSWDQNATPEQILADLPKFNDFEKIPAYSNLTNKIAQLEDEPRARRLIEQIPDEKQRAAAADAFEAEKISRTAAAGKLEEAKKLIGNLGEKKTQIRQLVALAVQYQKKNTEKDAAAAQELMRDARALASEFPEDESELDDLMELVGGYAVVDPPQAFRLFEPVVDQIGDFVQATAILSKYNRRDRSFIKGELVMRPNGGPFDSSLLYRYVAQIRLLGKVDLDRMGGFAEKFQRADARTLFKLFIAQGFLRDDAPPAAAAAP